MAAFECCDDLIQYNRRVLISSPGLPSLVPCLSWYLILDTQLWWGGGGASLRAWRGPTLVSELGAEIIEAAFCPGSWWFVQILANWIFYPGTCSLQRQLHRKCERKLSQRGKCDGGFNLLGGPGMGPTSRILNGFLFSAWEIQWTHQRSQT